MKILERGKTTEELTCYKCKSKLEIESSDIKSGQFGMCGDYDTEYYVICPVCGQMIRLDERKSLAVQIYLNQN